MSEELAKTKTATINTILTDEGKNEQVKNIEKKISTVDDQLYDLKENLLYKVKNYQAFQQDNLINNEQKKFTELNNTARNGARQAIQSKDQQLPKAMDDKRSNRVEK
ncbi:MAG: hypothetical protein IC227_01635 [Enterococcus lacertideformus]|uniref:Uncharacterized protein n=1 Tax=Enterococcus lacertideformus TaxID=2771493 RepID=A0A931AXF2_9ENTE|nr:hypothetical protein [Enterococcus lacertideformus]